MEIRTGRNSKNNSDPLNEQTWTGVFFIHGRTGQIPSRHQQEIPGNSKQRLAEVIAGLVALHTARYNPEERLKWQQALAKLKVKVREESKDEK